MKPCFIIILCFVSYLLPAQNKPADNKYSKKLSSTTTRDSVPVKNTTAPAVDTKDDKPCCCEELKSDCLGMNSVINTKDILLDFRTKDVSKADWWYTLKKGDFVRVKIMNYNPYLYQVLLDSKDSSVAVPIDGKLLGWFVDPGNIAGIAANLLGGAGVPPQQVEQVSLLTTSAVQDIDFNDRHALMEYIKMSDPKSTPRQNRRDSTPPTMLDTIAFVNKNMNNQDALIYNREKAFFSMKDRIEAKNYTIIRKLAVLRKLYPDCNSFKELLNSGDVAELENDMQKFRDEINQDLAITRKELENYQLILAPYKNFIGTKPELEEHGKQIENFYKELKTKLAAAYETVGYKNLAEIIAKLETVTMLSGCYVSFPIYIGKDVKNINVEFKPRFDSLALPAYTTSITLPLVQQRVWGVSSGIFFSGLHNEAYNSKPFTRQNSTGGTDTLYSLVDEKNSKLQMGIDALFYTGWKLNPTNNNARYLGVAFGAGLSIESKPKPRVLVGASYITGEKNRFMISAGIAGGQVSTLSRAYDYPGEYRKAPENYLKDIFKFNGFISVNYSFISQ